MTETVRPTSPHLQIYSWQISMVLSIVHRATGIALAAGTALLCWVLIALAAGPESFAAVHSFCASPFGLFLLFGWTWSLSFHLLNGVRHLAWDAGWGFGVPTFRTTGWIVAGLSFVCTAVVWFFVLSGASA